MVILYEKSVNLCVGQQPRWPPERCVTVLCAETYIYRHGAKMNDKTHTELANKKR